MHRFLVKEYFNSVSRLNLYKTDCKYYKIS